MMEADFGLLNAFGTNSVEFEDQIQQNGSLRILESDFGIEDSMTFGPQKVENPSNLALFEG